VTQPDRNAEQVQIALHDNGGGLVGAQPELLGQAFHRQYSGSGSGIGLYLARLLCMKMGGSFQVQSHALGKGFTVALTLPGTLQGNHDALNSAA
jgi:signal transduction histidine kinase